MAMGLAGGVARAGRLTAARFFTSIRGKNRQASNPTEAARSAAHAA
jgi:hypothetical protein